MPAHRAHCTLPALALAFLAFLAPRAAGQESPAHPRTVILVHHAEKQAAGGDNPPLSDAGAARAFALARHLEHAGVTHLFATEFRRTMDTLAPLAKATGLNVASIPARDSPALLAALSKLAPGSVAVVAGHSNTIPALVRSLVADARSIPDLGDGDHDRLYIVTRWDGAPACAIDLRY